jgi:hypothetical protein
MNTTKWFNLAWCVLLTFAFSAQKLIDSPFSYYGIGESESDQNACLPGYGGYMAAYGDSSIFNFANPASLGYLAQGQPIYSLGISNRTSLITTNGNTSYVPVTFINHLALGFKLNKIFGLGVGLMPFTRKGFEITDKVAVGTDSIIYQYSGKGGVNRTFLALSANLINRPSTHFSIGLSGQYLFGTSENKRVSALDQTNTNIGGTELKELRISDFSYEAGMQFSQDFKRHRIALGAVLRTEQSIHAILDEVVYYGSLSNLSAASVVDDSLGREGEITLPLYYNLGGMYSWMFSYSKRNNTQRKARISLIANLEIKDYSSYSSSFDGQVTYLNVKKQIVGVEFIPEIRFLETTVSTTFLERSKYRFGYYAYNLPYAINGTSVVDKGYSFGLTMPITVQQSFSSLNIGVSVGNRSNSGSVFDENYLGFQVGFVFAPAPYERWFKKRKLD